jgi:hypothetical protein
MASVRKKRRAVQIAGEYETNAGTLALSAFWSSHLHWSGHRFPTSQRTRIAATWGIQAGLALPEQTPGRSVNFERYPPKPVFGLGFRAWLSRVGKVSR